MLNVGLFELIFFMSFALIFLGPEKLIELLKTVFQWYQKIKLVLESFQTDIERELKLNALQNTLESEIKKVKDLEKYLSRSLYAEQAIDTPIYISLPYSSLGKIETLSPMRKTQINMSAVLSYAALNEFLFTPY